MGNKLFCNRTAYTLKCRISVRQGSKPGQELNTVDFTLGQYGTAWIRYGDANNPYVDQLYISAEANGTTIVSNQSVMTRGSNLDNQINMRNTIYIDLTGQSFVITTTNTN